MTGRLFSLLGKGLRLRCPRCGAGPLFRRPFFMYRHCPHCRLQLEPEPGYFVGAIYINYAATVSVAIPGHFILDVWAGVTLAQQLALWGSFCVIFPLIFFHHSRSLWLAVDHWLNPASNLYSTPHSRDSE